MRAVDRPSRFYSFLKEIESKKMSFCNQQLTSNRHVVIYVCIYRTVQHVVIYLCIYGTDRHVVIYVCIYDTVQHVVI